MFILYTVTYKDWIPTVKVIAQGSRQEMITQWEAIPDSTRRFYAVGIPSKKVPSVDNILLDDIMTDSRHPASSEYPTISQTLIRQDNPMKNFRPPYHVDFHSERGEVTIYVTDADGKDVWYADTDAVNQLVEDGFISTRGFVMGRNMRPDVLERSVLDYLREVGVITNVMPESRRYFADEQDSLYDENPRRANPTQTDVENWTERYRSSVQKRVDGVPSQTQYVVKIVTTKGETAFLRVGKGTKFDTDANSARVYRSGEKANEAATKVSNWLKKKNPAKWKAIKSISAEPKK